MLEKLKTAIVGRHQSTAAQKPDFKPVQRAADPVVTEHVAALSARTPVPMASLHRQSKSGLYLPLIMPLTQGIDVRAMTPGSSLDVPDFDPVQFILNQVCPNEELIASATESGGSATATVAPTNEAVSLFAFLLSIQPKRDAAGFADALLTITRQNFETHAHSVNESEDGTSGVTTHNETNDATQTCRLGVTAGLGEQQALVFLGKRPSGIAKVVPAVALAREAVQASLGPATLDVAFAFTGMPSGCGAQVVVTAITPASEKWDRFVEIMTEAGYHR